MEKTALVQLVQAYKSDPESVYNTWFVGGAERMKAFRADLADIPLAFIPFDELSANCDALCRFGDDHTILQKIARARPAL